MKKLKLLLILACVLATASCGARSETAASASPFATPEPTAYPAKTITPDQIKTFNYRIGDFGIYDEYSVGRDKLMARMLLYNFYLPEIEITQTWTEEKWDAFTKDLLACGIADWKLLYYHEGYFTGDFCYDGSWHLEVTGDFGTIASEGGESPDDGQFSSMFNEYFYWPPLVPVGPQAEPVELVAESTLPEPEQSEWYEWDKAGTYTLNPEGFLHYIEDRDLLIIDYDYGLNVSSLDSGEKHTIIEEAYDIDYNDGWIYYSKWDEGIWRVKPDGTEAQFVADINNQDVWYYDGNIYFFESRQFYCRSIENGLTRMIIIPGYPLGPYFFDDGSFYYGAASDDDSNRMCVYRHNLETGQTIEMTNRSMGNFVVRDGMLYYMDDGLMRTDGNITESVKSSVGYYFNLYRNYLLYINYMSDWTCMLYALNLDTGMEYELFELPVPFGSNQSDIYVMENTVFIHDALLRESSPVFRIAFEGDTARLWKLSGLTKQ